MSDPALPDNDRRDPTYLGDGVYAAHDGNSIWLRANNADWYGLAMYGDIALEPGVLLGLIEYAERMGYLPISKKQSSEEIRPAGGFREKTD